MRVFNGGGCFMWLILWFGRWLKKHSYLCVRHQKGNGKNDRVYNQSAKKNEAHKEGSNTVTYKKLNQNVWWPCLSLWQLSELEMNLFMFSSGNDISPSLDYMRTGDPREQDLYPLLCCLPGAYSHSCCTAGTQ